MKWLVAGVLVALALAAIFQSRIRQTAAAAEGTATPQLRTVEVDGATVGYEQKFRELAAIHYRDADHELKIEAEWVGWGENRKFYLFVYIPASPGDSSHPMTDADVQLVASRMSRGLTALAIPHAILRLGARVAIPAEECDEGLRSYQRWMESKGVRVTIDRAKPLMEETPMPGGPDLLARSEAEIQEQSRRSQQAGDWLVGYRTLEPQLLFASDDMKAALSAAGR